jgi:hypothetical protein
MRHKLVGAATALALGACGGHSQHAGAAVGSAGPDGNFVLGSWEARDSDCSPGTRMTFTETTQTVSQVSPVDGARSSSSIPIHYVPAGPGKMYVMGNTANPNIFIYVNAGEMRGGNWPQCYFRRTG